jgi:methyltransferase
MNNCFSYLILFYIFQRFHELWVSKSNEKKIRQLKIELTVNKSDVKTMLFLHTSWFVSLLMERPHEMPTWLTNSGIVILFYSLLIIFQIIRWHTQKILDIAWLIYPAKLSTVGTIKNGLYRYISHPNYYIVMGEFIIIPLLGGRMYTLFIFLPLIIFQLMKRIRLENHLHRQVIISFIMSLSIALPTIFAETALAEVKNLNFKYSSYEESEKSSNILWFEGVSKKLGLFKTHFIGYPLNFSVTMDQVQFELKNISLEIDANSFTTDNSSRDKKMKELCLSTEQFKTIKVSVKEAILLPKEDGQILTQNIVVMMTIRNVTKELPLEAKIEKKGKQYVIGAQSTLSLKAFEIPDPSIAIASVNDEFIIRIKLDVQQ